MEETVEEGDDEKTAAKKAAAAAKRVLDQKRGKDAAKEVSDELDAAGVPKNENWHKGNKDQLLFERLTKKWTK